MHRRSGSIEPQRQSLHKRVNNLRRSGSRSSPNSISSLLDDNTVVDYKTKRETQWWKRLDEPSQDSEKFFMMDTDKALSPQEDLDIRTENRQSSVYQNMETEPCGEDSSNYSLSSVSLSMEFPKQRGMLLQNQIKQPQFAKTNNAQIKNNSVITDLHKTAASLLSIDEDNQDDIIDKPGRSKPLFKNNKKIKIKEKLSMYEPMLLNNQSNSIDSEVTDVPVMKTKTLFKNRKTLNNDQYALAVEASSLHVVSDQSDNEESVLKSKTLFKNHTNTANKEQFVKKIEGSLLNTGSVKIYDRTDIDLAGEPVLKTKPLFKNSKNVNLDVYTQAIEASSMDVISSKLDQSNDYSKDIESSKMRSIQPSKNLFKKIKTGNQNKKKSVFADAISLSVCEDKVSDSPIHMNKRSSIIRSQQDDLFREKSKIDENTIKDVAETDIRGTNKRRYRSKGRYSDIDGESIKSGGKDNSPSSNTSETINFDKWKQLASSTMIDIDSNLNTPVTKKNAARASRQLIPNKSDLQHSDILEEKECSNTASLHKIQVHQLEKNHPNSQDRNDKVMSITNTTTSPKVSPETHFDNENISHNEKSKRISMSNQRENQQVTPIVEQADSDHEVSRHNRELSMKNQSQYESPDNVRKMKSPGNNITSFPDKQIEMPSENKTITPNFSRKLSLKRQSVGTWLKSADEEEDIPKFSQSDIDKQVLEEMKAKRTNPPVRRSTLVVNNQTDNIIGNNKTFDYESIKTNYSLRHSGMRDVSVNDDITTHSTLHGSSTSSDSLRNKNKISSPGKEIHTDISNNGDNVIPDEEIPNNIPNNSCISDIHNKVGPDDCVSSNDIEAEKSLHGNKSKIIDVHMLGDVNSDIEILSEDIHNNSHDTRANEDIPVNIEKEILNEYIPNETHSNAGIPEDEAPSNDSSDDSVSSAVSLNGDINNENSNCDISKGEKSPDKIEDAESIEDEDPSNDSSDDSVSSAVSFNGDINNESSKGEKSPDKIGDAESIEVRSLDNELMFVDIPNQNTPDVSKNNQMETSLNDKPESPENSLQLNLSSDSENLNSNKTPSSDNVQSYQEADSLSVRESNQNSISKRSYDNMFSIDSLEVSKQLSINGSKKNTSLKVQSKIKSTNFSDTINEKKSPINIRKKTNNDEAGTNQSIDISKKQKSANVSYDETNDRTLRSSKGQSTPEPPRSKKMKTFISKNTKVNQNKENYTRSDLKKYLDKLQDENASRLAKANNVFTEKRSEQNKKIAPIPPVIQNKKPIKIKSKRHNKLHVNIHNDDDDELDIKRPKLYMKEQWITPQMYKFVERKLQDRYGIKTRTRCERFIIDLAYHVNKVIKSKTDFKKYIVTLKREMARLKIVKTHFDFYRFIQDFLPMYFRLKAIPSCGREQGLTPDGSIFDSILSP